MRRVGQWLRYRVCRAAAVQGPWFWADDRYPRTVAGGVRYFREQVAPAEVFWYELQSRVRAAAALEPFVELARANRELDEACARWADRRSPDAN
jgi:hypothetical protein